MRVLIISCQHPLLDSRPLRFYKTLSTFLKKGMIHALYVGSYEKDNVSNSLITFQKGLLKKIILRLFGLLMPSLLSRYFCFFQRKNCLLLEDLNINVIFCHDLVLLPIALSLKEKDHTIKVIFDAREFYPREFESSFLWKVQFQRLYTHLCRDYLQKCDAVITVSKGLQKLYKETFNCSSHLFYSLPFPYDITPFPVDNAHIKLIYHGACNPDRGIHILIQMMDFLPKTFHLTLVLVNGRGSKGYEKRLHAMAQKRNVSFLEPFSQKDLIEKTAFFDIGLCCFPRSTVNLEHAMPNKLFEYIQSRLMVVTTPLRDLSAFVLKENIGKVASGFSAKEMADTFLCLTNKEIDFYKGNASGAAKRYTHDSQEYFILNLLSKKDFV